MTFEFPYFRDAHGSPDATGRHDELFPLTYGQRIERFQEDIELGMRAAKEALLAEGLTAEDGQRTVDVFFDAFDGRMDELGHSELFNMGEQL